MTGLDQNLVWLAGICGAIISIIGLIEKATKPIKELKQRIADLENTVSRNGQKLVGDHESLKKQEQVNEMLLDGVNNILKHELTGNHTSEMRECSKRIESFIYKKGGSL